MQSGRPLLVIVSGAPASGKAFVVRTDDEAPPAYREHRAFVLDRLHE